MPGFNVPLNTPSIACPGDLVEFLVEQSAGLGKPSHTVETARSHRWKFLALQPLQSGALQALLGKDQSVLVYASKCTRPTVEIDEIKIHHGQGEIYRPGKHRWAPIDMSFYDAYFGGSSVDPAARLNAGVAEKIYKWWSKAVINTTNNTILRSLYVTAKVAMLDGGGKTVWEYKLYDCWPIKVTPSDLDYSNTQLSEISVTMRYNKAEEITAKEG